MTTVTAAASSRPLHPDYHLVDGPPTVETYLQLRRLSGLSSRTASQAAAVLPGSWFFCHVIHTSTSTPVGMGKVVGDGGWYFIIADMAVIPEHQRKGLGDAILRRCLEEIKAKVGGFPEEGGVKPRAYISLGSKPPGRKLYAKHGFVETAPRTIGMAFEPVWAQPLAKEINMEPST